MNLNELASTGAPIEVTFYDAEFDEEDEEMRDEDSRDDFMIVFVGPTPAAIMQVQRDLLVQDVISLMERHFDASELTGGFGDDDITGDAGNDEIIPIPDYLAKHAEGRQPEPTLIETRVTAAALLDALAESLEIGKPPRGSGNGGHRGRNKPRHLH